MRDVVVYYLAVTLGLLTLLTVVVVVQSLRDLARRALRRAFPGGVRLGVDRAAATGRPSVDGWTSQPV